MIKALLPLAMDDRAFSDRSAVAQLRGVIAERERQLEVTTLKAGRMWEEWAVNPSPSLKDVACRTDAEQLRLNEELATLRDQFRLASGRVSAAEHLSRVKDIASALYQPDLERRLITRRKVMIAFNGLIGRIELGEQRGSISLQDGNGTAKYGVGVLFIDRAGKVSGIDLVKRGDESTPYRKRLAKTVLAGSSPFG